MIKIINEAKNLEGKKVLVRVGINVPLNKKNEIVSDFRLKKIMETINFLVEKKAKIILMGHIGREKKENLIPVFQWLQRHKESLQVYFDEKTFQNFNEEKVKELQKKISHLENGEILLLDNLRQSELEKANDADFAKKIASMGDIYVNEAFSVSHREHSSMVGVPEFFQEKYVGLLFEKELEQAKKILNPGKNSIAILGGAKIKTKLPLIEKISEKFSLNILGGGIANNFFKYLNFKIGKSIFDENFLNLKKYITDKIFIPNIVIVDDGKNKKVEKEISEVLETDNILDISPSAFYEIEEKLKEANFVFFNGPMGYYEGGYSDGTKYLLDILANENNYFIAGGGDTATAIFELGLENNVDWVSTGGGALIEYLAREKLPALEILKK